MIQVTREEDNALFTLIKIEPWPDQRWSACVRVLREKRDDETGEPINRLVVIHGHARSTPHHAREYAQALLQACDIAEQLEREGAIVLEGEAQS